MATASTAGRFCSRCERRTCVCICASLPTAPLRLHRCRVLVLQHWRENKNKKGSGTAHLAKLCIADVSVLVDRMGMREGGGVPRPGCYPVGHCAPRCYLFRSAGTFTQL